MCQKVPKIGQKMEEKFPEIRPKLPCPNKTWHDCGVAHGQPWPMSAIQFIWSDITCQGHVWPVWTPCPIKQAAHCSRLVWWLFEPFSFHFVFEVNLGYCLPHLIDQLGVNWVWFFWVEPLTLGHRIGLVTWWYPIRRCSLSWQGPMIVQRHPLRVF